MNYESAWLVTCGVCCIYPALAFAAGAWYAKNSHRIHINWKFWKKEQ